MGLLILISWCFFLMTVCRASKTFNVHWDRQGRSRYIGGILLSSGHTLLKIKPNTSHLHYHTVGLTFGTWCQIWWFSTIWLNDGLHDIDCLFWEVQPLQTRHRKIDIECHQEVFWSRSRVMPRALCLVSNGSAVWCVRNPRNATCT